MPTKTSTYGPLDGHHRRHEGLHQTQGPQAGSWFPSLLRRTTCHYRPGGGSSTAGRKTAKPDPRSAGACPSRLQGCRGSRALPNNKHNRTGGGRSTRAASPPAIGGGKRRYRIIDFKQQGRRSAGRHHRITANRSTPHRPAGLRPTAKRHILAPDDGLKSSGTVVSGRTPTWLATASPSRTSPRHRVHIELKPGRAGRSRRAAGFFARSWPKEAEYAQLRMPSGEIRRIHLDAAPPPSSKVGNLRLRNVSRSARPAQIWLGIHPTVRRRGHGRSITRTAAAKATSDGRRRRREQPTQCKTQSNKAHQ